MTQKKRAHQNRTLELSAEDKNKYIKKLLTLSAPAVPNTIINKTINQDLQSALPFLPAGFVDLLFIDPPYNLSKTYNSHRFRQLPAEAYITWMDSWFAPLMKVLKPAASVYICSDWRSSFAVQQVAEKYLTIRNRITWEREKGRGASRNWKNCSEDIWFCTVSEKYTFNVEAVKLRRQVIAPYRHKNGQPKDWNATNSGNYRLTHPSNIWTDISIPFWSMPENTDHPTQKPEKLLAKIILASTNKGDVILDPFSGSGTTAAAAAKLDRKYISIEVDATYAGLIEKRIDLAGTDKSIQGYADGVFWERNTYQQQKTK